MQTLDRWLEEAQGAEAATPAAMTLVTSTPDGRPSARVVSLKRLEPAGLIFTTGLWTRKADELRSNPNVATVFHWPSLARQARIEGRAEVAERELAEELFAQRPRAHRLQTVASRQGERIDGLAPLRERLAELHAETGEDPIPCPEDWGAIRIVPSAIELWEEGADRLHNRVLYTAVEGGWDRTQLAP